MSHFKILRYILVILVILFILFSTIYYIKPFKTAGICPFDKNNNEFEWDLEDEIKKFTNIEDIYIKNKK